jgi:hypothetical protein
VSCLQADGAPRLIASTRQGHHSCQKHCQGLELKDVLRAIADLELSPVQAVNSGWVTAARRLSPITAVLVGQPVLSSYQGRGGPVSSLGTFEGGAAFGAEMEAPLYCGDLSVK